MQNCKKNGLNLILSDLRECFQTFYENRLLKIILYGSQARGDEEIDSDIDILIVLESPVNPADEILRTGEIVADLSLKYNVVISCIFMDEERFENRNGPFLRNIRKDGILV